MFNLSNVIRDTIFAVILCSTFLSEYAYAQTTAFIYQGKLTDSGNPATGIYDFEFRLFDTLSEGTQKGTTLTLAAVEVSNGTFSVQLDFAGCADCFNGGARFLDISVRPAGGGSYTLLTPRQPLISTPYAVRSMTAGVAETAADATRLGGQLPSGFIQNTTSQQSTATDRSVEETGLCLSTQCRSVQITKGEIRDEE